MKLREKFPDKISGEDIVIAVAEGNPGATAAIREILTFGGSETGIAVIAHLADMNIRGSQLGYAFQEFCNRDVSVLIAHVMTRNSEMVDAINSFFEPSPKEMPYRAVVKGALGAPELHKF